MLPGKGERKATVGHKRKLRAFGIVDGKNRLQRAHLLLHVMGQGRHRHRLDIDGVFSKKAQINFAVHFSTLFLILIVWTMLSGKARVRST